MRRPDYPYYPTTARKALLFLRSRLPVLLLWDAGVLAGAGVLTLSPAIGWRRAEALYALLLNLAAQAIWLTMEARKRARLERQLRSDAACDDGLCHSDEDIITAELRSYKQRIDKALGEERERLSDYGDYLTAWVHELKTPLTVLRLGLTARDGDDPSSQDRGKKRLESAELLDELEHIGFLVDQALFYARSHSFSADYLARSVELPALVRRLLARNARQCILRQLRPRFGPGFCQAESEPERWRVVSDPVWLGFMLQQVLSNSLNYAPPGSELGFDLEPGEGCLRLIIEDQGPGVPPEELARIFDRGFIGQSRDRRGAKAASTGIGLYLVKKLAARLGHEVWAESPPRSGEATFGTGLRIVLEFRGDRC